MLLARRTAGLGSIIIGTPDVQRQNSAVSCGITDFTSTGSGDLTSILGGVPKVRISSGKRVGCGKGTVGGFCVRKRSVLNNHCSVTAGGVRRGSINSMRIVPGRRPVGTLRSVSFSRSPTVGVGLGRSTGDHLMKALGTNNNVRRGGKRGFNGLGI